MPRDESRETSRGKRFGRGDLTLGFRYCGTNDPLACGAEAWGCDVAFGRTVLPVFDFPYEKKNVMNLLNAEKIRVVRTYQPLEQAGQNFRQNPVRAKSSWRRALFPRRLQLPELPRHPAVLGLDPAQRERRRGPVCGHHAQRAQP